MASAAMVFDIFAKDRASATFARVGASAESAGLRAEAASKRMHGFAASLGALAAVELGRKSLQMAGDFQQATNVLVTAAGETQANLAGVRKGIMDIAVGTGTPLKDLTDGMYQIEKAGYRGADGLNILKTASQGAREEGANLATVTSAMTSIMASYHIPVGKNVSVMNQLKTAAGESKTTMEQFAGSLSTVLPVASANHISFAKVAGALATLTQHGTSADEATQELSNTIRNLSAPNMVAVREMQQLGISSQDVSKHLGDRGVAGTLNYLSQTVLRKMGPSGKVLLDVFMKSQDAGKDLTAMMSRMAPETRKLAKEYESGALTAGNWRFAIGGLTPEQANLAKQFAVTYNRAHGFNTALKNGLPGTQTYTEAIKKMTGGANGLNTTLQLTGDSTAGTTERIKKIADAAKGAGKDVDGWASTQKLFNVQLDMFKQRVAVLGVNLGTALMPSVLGVVNQLGSMLTYVQQNQDWLVPLSETALTVAGAIWGVNKATLAWKSTMGALRAAGAVYSTVIGGAASKLGTMVSNQGGAAVGAGNLIKKLGGAAAALGPWGVAIGVAATALGIFLTNQHKAMQDTPQFKQAVEDYAGAFDQVKGAINRATAALDDNVRATTAKGLQDKGSFDLAEKLGISTKLLTDATLGNADAQKQVNDIIQQNFALDPKLGKSYSDRHNAAEALSQQLQLQSTAELEAIRKANQMKGAMDASTVSTRLVADATKFYNDRLTNLTASVKKNGTSLDENTAKGKANRDAVHEAILAVNAKAAADFASTLKTKGLSAALKVASTDLQNGKKDIDKAAHAAGLNTGATDKMIRKYLETPKQVQTDVKTAGVGKAIGDFNNIDAHIRGINNKRVFINFDTNAYKIGKTKFAVNLTAPSSVGRMAFGGTVPGYSPHPRADNIPIMATAGEEVIPVGPATKHRALLKAIIADGYADGGTVRRHIDVNVGRVPAAAIQFPSAAAWFANAWARGAGQMLGGAFAKGLQGTMPGSGGGGSVNFGNLPTGGSNRALGHAMMLAYGWGSMWPALNALWTRESGWNNHALNASSGAFGIPQSLPASKMGAAAVAGNAAAQIAWGLNYIKSVYGNPNNAWAHETKFSWYGNGGTFDRPTIIGVGERGRERVLNPLETRRYERMERHGGGYGATVVINIDAPNWHGSFKELEAAMLQSARTGGMKKIIREATK